MHVPHCLHAIGLRVAATGVAVISLLCGSTAMATPALVASDAGGRVTVGTDDYPSAGWQLVFDDSLNGSISEFHLAGVDGGANLCADGSMGPRAALFEKVWGTERGAHWLSGLFGRADGESQLLESNAVRARVYQVVLSTDAEPEEVPARIFVTYTVYHTGRLYIDVQWALNDLGVLGSVPYADNSWRLVLANRDFLGGAVSEYAHTAWVDNAIPGLPELVFAAYPSFWHNGMRLTMDDPAVREAYFGAGTLDLTVDPFAGFAGARLGGSYDPANPYAAGDLFRHALLIDWSRPGPGDPGTAAMTGIAFWNPDPLDGTTGVGRIVAGTLDPDDLADGDHDGFAESEGCYVMRAAANVVALRLAPARMAAGGEALPLENLVCKIRDVDAAHDSLFIMASTDGGANYQFLVPGIDYRMTTHADEAGLGEDVRLISIVKQFPVSSAPDVRLTFGELEGLITPTVLSGPDVSVRPGAITISWRCTERGVYHGYHVSRSQTASGAWSRLTMDPVPDGADPGDRTFSWIDRTAVPGREYRYRVEALPTDGGAPFVITASEPVLAVPTAATAAHPGARSDVTLTPNPFRRGGSLAIDVRGDLLAGSPDGVDLAILDAQGRRVRVLLRDARFTSEPAAGIANWDGRDDAGRALPGGLYFMRLRAGTRVETRKIVLLP